MPKPCIANNRRYHVYKVYSHSDRIRFGTFWSPDSAMKIKRHLMDNPRRQYDVEIITEIKNP